MAHYFTNDEVRSEPEVFTYTYKNHKYTFHSDAGVFSKHFIDYGTRVLLNTIEVKDAKNLLDVGCGYGPIGLLLKGSHNDLSVDMVDVNLRALGLAKVNAKENNLDVSIYESDAYEQVIGTYDLIVTNPPVRAGKKVVNEILKGSFEHLNSNGRLAVVIQKKQGAPSAKKLMTEVFGNCEILKRDKGYYILQSIKA